MIILSKVDLALLIHDQIQDTVIRDDPLIRS